MTQPINGVLEFPNIRGITGLADAVNPTEAVTLQQLNAAVEGISWKDSARVAVGTNVNTASPGATLDGVSMATSDRVLLRGQTTVPQNGIWIWNGAATPMSRALDASTFGELEGAVVTVEEGTDAGTSWRQTQVNGVLDTNDVVWTAFGTSAPAMSESTAGIGEVGTQGEVDGGVLDDKIVTPLKLATWSGRQKRSAQTIGDGVATSIVVTHNLGSEDITCQVWETGGFKREVFCEKRLTSTNSTTILFAVAPASNSVRAVFKY